MNSTLTDLSLEVTETTELIPIISQQPCYLVNNLNNSHDQCKFVIDNNCLEKDSAFDYVHLVYCELGYEWRYISISLLAFLIVVLFLALSAIADEFLCPSLLSVVKNLRMSDSLAGVTLLAFGNGCPDIFASIAAASSDRSELIVGELLGAGIFCTCIVSGLIFIHSDFELATRPILRDTTFYLLAVYLVWCFCNSREVTFYGALLVALGGQAIYSKFMGNYPIAETQALQLDYDSDLEENRKESNNCENWYKWREESFRRQKEIKIKNQQEIDNLSKSKSTTKRFPNVRVEQKNGITTIHLGFDSLSTTTRSTYDKQVKDSFENIDLKICSSIRNKQGHINEAFVCESQENRSNGLFEWEKIAEEAKHMREKRIIEQRRKEAQQMLIKKQKENSSKDDNLYKIKKFNSTDLNQLDDLLAHVTPINWSVWRSKSLTSKIINILKVPMLFAAILTIPVVDYEKKRNNWCRLLNSIHCITIPMLLTFVIGASFNVYTLFNLIPIPLILLPASILLCFFMLRTTSLNEPPKYHPIFAYFGFLMSILWIYRLVNEIIGLLKTIGIMFSMTDTAIGLGILAWGNSLGDIVANITLAEAGYPRMALGASIGAPLLNLLIGFGLSFTLSLKPGESAEIEYTPTTTLLCSTLAIVLLAIMLSTLVPPERSRKPFGYFLISGYCVYFVLAVCFEYNIIKF